MNVLFIGPLPEPVTGQSLACKVFLDHLKTKHTVATINLSKRSFAPGMDSIGRVAEVVGFIWQTWRRGRRASAIYFTVSESLAGNLKDLLIFLVCFRRLRYMVIHLHGGAGMKCLLASRRSLLGRINAFFLKRIGAVIVLGERLLPIYKDFVPESRLHVVPNFAEDPLFIDSEAIRVKFEQGLPLRVLFLSNFLPGKGHDELLRAYLGLTAELQAKIQVDFAGSFQSDQDRVKFLAAIAPHATLRYHGSVRGEQKKELFHQAHIFCLPTYYPYEGQPISILEAYASGCSVMATDHSGILDIFRDTRNGILIEACSDSIQRAMRNALRDWPALMRQAQTNRLEADFRYRADRYNGALSSILEQLNSDRELPFGHYMS